MEHPDKHQPHVFIEADELPFSPPIAPRGGGFMGSNYSPPPITTGKSAICELCHKPRADRLHIEGEAEADDESPRWG